MKKPLIAIALLAWACVSASAQQTSDNNERLRQALRQFPAADADKDGILTMEEGMAFRTRMKADGKVPGADAAKAGDAKTVTYKTVGKTKLSLQIHEPEGHKATHKVPAIVFFHGGGWRKGNPSQFAAQCEYLSRRGMVAISAQYRLVSEPGVKVENCVEDAKSAMRWVRGHAAQLGVDPARIASGGGSAGGHLGACVQLVDTFDSESDDRSVSAKPNAMILFNPAMATAPDPRMEKEAGDLARRAPRVSEIIRGDPSAVSPLHFATTAQPPCIMFFGTADDLLKPAEWFRDDSVKAGNSCRIVLYEGQGHSFFNRQPYQSRTLAEVDQFLVGLGWLDAK